MNTANTTDFAREVESVLDVLSAKLGTTVGFLMETLTAFYLFVGWANLVGGLALLAVSLYVGVRILRHAAATEAKNQDGFGWFVVGTLSLVVGSVAAILFIGHGIYYLASPATHALREILGVIQ